MLNVISQSVVILNVVAPVQCLTFQNIKAHHFVSKMGQAGRHDIKKTLSITAVVITTLSKMKLNITILRMMTVIMTLLKCSSGCHAAKRHYAECTGIPVVVFLGILRSL
jgi:hypothetical protein